MSDVINTYWDHFRCLICNHEWQSTESNPDCPACTEHKANGEEG